MSTTQNLNQQTAFNATDLRFRLGQILNELDQKKQPILIISRSKPKAWLYPFKTNVYSQDLFSLWRSKASPKYKKIKAKKLITLIRKDRERK